MNKFLSIFVAMLCGVSVLATSNAGFAMDYDDEILGERFGRLAIKGEWSYYRRDYEKALQEGNRQEAFRALQSIYKFSQNGNYAAETWLRYAGEKIRPLTDQFGPLDQLDLRRAPATKNKDSEDLKQNQADFAIAYGDKDWENAWYFLKDISKLSKKNTPEGREAKQWMKDSWHDVYFLTNNGGSLDNEGYQVKDTQRPKTSPVTVKKPTLFVDIPDGDYRPGRGKFIFEGKNFSEYNVYMANNNCGLNALDITREEAMQTLARSNALKGNLLRYLRDSGQEGTNFDAVLLPYVGRYCLGANVNVLQRGYRNALVPTTAEGLEGYLAPDSDLPTINLLWEGQHYRILIPEEHTEEANLLRDYARAKEHLAFQADNLIRQHYSDENYARATNMQFLGGWLKDYVNWVEAARGEIEQPHRQAAIAPAVRAPAIDPWVAARNEFTAHYQTDRGRAQRAFDELHRLANSGVGAAKTWLANSNEVLRFGTQEVGEVEQPHRQLNAPVGRPAIVAQPQWGEARNRFLANFQGDRDIAQFALNELNELANFVPAAKTWLAYSNEVVRFLAQEVGEVEQPRRQVIPAHVDHAAVNPYTQVQFRRDYQALQNQFQPILNQIRQIPQGHDVHILDNFVVGNEGNLVQIAGTIFPNNGQLSLAQVNTNLKTFIDAHPDVLAAYNYNGRVFTRDEMFRRIDQAYQNDMTPALCSHVYELAMQLLNSGHQPSNFGVQRLFDAVVENLETQGGCFQGRRNRQFVALSSMLAYCGLAR